MKQFAFFATALLLLFSCTQQTDTETKEIDEVAIQNVELVEKLIQAYENEDIEALKEIYSPNTVSIGPRIDMVDSTLAFLKSNEEWFIASDSIQFDVIAILPQVVE